MKNVFLILCTIALVLVMACGEDPSEEVINLPPLAVIIADEEAGLNQQVNLSAQGSLDPEGENLTYSWTFTSIPSGSNATLTGSNTINASFTTDVAGNYIVNLNISDGVLSAEESITIVASMGLVPTAIITNSESQEITEDNNVFRPNESFTLSGNTSFDIEDGLNLASYSWEITDQPAASNPQLSSSTDSETTFTSDIVGEYTIQLTVTDSEGNEGLSEVTLAVRRIPILLLEDISSNETLENVYEDPQYLDYLVPTNNSTLNVAADLTIAAGVSIGFQEDTGLFVESSGSLTAVGTAADSIEFKGEENVKGFWKGISIASNTNSNNLEYVKILDGGNSGFDGFNIKANIIVIGDGKIGISNTTISNGDGSGIYLRNKESELTDFASNQLSTNNVPITSMANHYHLFDSESDYTGNSNDFIESISGETIDQDVTWNNLNVPYRLSVRVVDIGSNVTIQPGAEFIGQSDAGIEVNENGSLNATGTMSESIVFRGENDTEGSWRGLSFESNNTSNRLIYTEISNGGQRGFDGANLKSNVIVQENGRLVIQFSTITQSDDAGVYLRNNDSKLPDFSNNTINNNNVPVRIAPINWHYLDSETDYAGNTNDYIDGFGSNASINQTVSWNPLNVPYRIPNNTESIIGGGITVLAGTNFISRTDGGIQAINDGFLRIEGTVNDPITFAGEQNVTGYWRGLRFDTRNTNNVISHASISNGGSRGFDGANRRANVEIGRSGLLNMTNTSINLSGDFGIRIQRDGSLISSGVTFSGNSAGNIDDEN